MKEFKDLEFNTHPSGMGGKQAVITFDNGYGASIIIGSTWYSNGIDTYELAVLCNRKLDYSTYITDDVLGYLTEQEVSEYMKKIQEL